MTDQSVKEKTTDTTDQQPQIKMQALTQYIRDLSFENSVAQKGVEGNPEAHIQVQVNVDGKKQSSDHQYEVIVRLNIDSKSKDEDASLYHMEIEYGGMFHVENVPDNQLHPYLLIECPRILFPFLRRLVSDVTRDAGFPSLNLENIDFVKLYREEMARRVEENEKKEKTKKKRSAKT